MVNKFVENTRKRFYANRITRWICVSYHWAYELIYLLTSNYTWNLQSADLRAAYYAFIKIFSFVSMNRLGSHENTLTRQCFMDAQSWLNVWACVLTGGVTIIIRGCNTQSNLCSLESNQWQNVNLIRAAGRSWPWLNYNLLADTLSSDWLEFYIFYVFLFQGQICLNCIDSICGRWPQKIIWAKFMFLSIWQ